VKVAKWRSTSRTRGQGEGAVKGAGHSCPGRGRRLPRHSFGEDPRAARGLLQGNRERVEGLLGSSDGHQVSVRSGGVSSTGPGAIALWAEGVSCQVGAAERLQPGARAGGESTAQVELGDAQALTLAAASKGRTGRSTEGLVRCAIPMWGRCRYAAWTS